MLGRNRLATCKARWLLLVAVTAGAMVVFSATALARHHHRSHPGCGSYCRNAGGFGSGGGTPPPPRMSLLAKTVHVQQGIVSLPLRCLTRKACKGVLILAAAQGGPKTSPPLQPGELARADLYIPGRTEWIIDVTLTKAGRKYARAHHNVKTLITAFYKNPEGLDPFTLTIVS